jgi:hypothetical protein
MSQIYNLTNQTQIFLWCVWKHRFTTHINWRIHCAISFGSFSGIWNHLVSALWNGSQKDRYKQFNIIWRRHSATIDFAFRNNSIFFWSNAYTILFLSSCPQECCSCTKHATFGCCYFYQIFANHLEQKSWICERRFLGHLRQHLDLRIQFCCQFYKVH